MHGKSVEKGMKELGSQLLLAESPSEVSEIICELESNYDVDWRPLGQEENNYGTVQTQASSPMPCFVEIKANADDAILIRGFEENAESGADPDEYKTMEEAAEAFAPEDGEIEIIADGESPNNGNVLNLTIRDDGCGQPQDRFEDTFLGLHTPGVIKQKYSFTQGQYGMGSTGVLQFCGDRHTGCYKFVASASHKEPEKWSWSLIRQNREENQYEYCVVDGRVPGFEGAFGECLTDRVPGAEDEDYGQRFGSFVKVYDYRMDVSRADISGQEPFLYKFERYVVNSPLEIRLTETRYENTSVTSNTTRGFLPSLDESRHDVLIEGRETLEYDFEQIGSEILGTREIEVILFKDDDELEGEDTTRRAKNRFLQKASGHKDMTGRTGIHRSHAVMFTVNGQTHGDQGLSFLKNQCGYSKVADDTVVIVRFDDFANPDMSDLFKPTRDRLQDGKNEAKYLQKGLKDALQESDMLADEEDRRRAKRGTDDAEFEAESFESFVKENPEFASYVNSGRKISGPRLQPESSGQKEETADVTSDGDGDSGNQQTETQKSLKIPSFLTGIDDYNPDGEHELWDESTGGTMQVSVPVNQRRKVRFATDAQDDYLTRETLGGELIAQHSDMVQMTELHGGVLALTVEPPEEAEAGDTRMMTVRLTRPSLDTEAIADLDFDHIDASREELLESDDPVSRCYEELTPDTVDTESGNSVDGSPLYGHVEIQYKEEVEDESQSTPDGSPDNDSGEETSESSEGDSSEGQSIGGLDMPSIHLVYERHWNFDPDDSDFDRAELDLDEDEIDLAVAREFDESVLLRVDESVDGTISGLTITINMDSAPLRSFIVNNNVKETYKEYVESQYKMAIVFMVISQYRELLDSRKEEFEEKEIGMTDIIEDSMNGIGQVLMPMIFPENELETIAE